MRHQARDTPVAVEERVDPEEAMMHRSDRLDLPDTRQADAVGFIEPGQESRKGAGWRRPMPTNLDIPLAKAPRNNGKALAGVRVLDPAQFFRQSLAEFLMQPTGIVGRRGP